LTTTIPLHQRRGLDLTAHPIGAALVVGGHMHIIGGGLPSMACYNPSDCPKVNKMNGQKAYYSLLRIGFADFTGPSLLLLTIYDC